MNKLIIIAFAFLMTGCATTLTEEEAVEACPGSEEVCLADALQKKIEHKRFVRDYNRAIDMENWQTCLLIHKTRGSITYHIGHSHDRKRANRRVDPFDVKSDLMHNNCRSLIRQVFGKDAWAEHY